jgi:hypothetical protein
MVKLKPFFLILIFLNIFDAISTALLISISSRFVEKNPLVNYLIEVFGPNPIMISKILLVTILLTYPILVNFQTSNKTIIYSTKIIVTIYALVAMLHLRNLACYLGFLN